MYPATGHEQTRSRGRSSVNLLTSDMVFKMALLQWDCSVIKFFLLMWKSLANSFLGSFFSRYLDPIVSVTNPALGHKFSEHGGLHFSLLTYPSHTTYIQCSVAGRLFSKGAQHWTSRVATNWD